MAKSAKPAMRIPDLKTRIANEPDTVRAAHIRRVMAGADALAPLTGRSDLQSRQRQLLIDALPAVKPFVEEPASPKTNHLSGLAALQAQIHDLQARLAKMGG
jgi:hypothetical protein